jgi:hypothetical protein
MPNLLTTRANYNQAAEAERQGRRSVTIQEVSGDYGQKSPAIQGIGKITSVSHAIFNHRQTRQFPEQLCAFHMPPLNHPS